jgi:hypothetical protein
LNVWHRYTRFINIDFIQDIITALRELIGQDNSPLSVPTQLQCAITALQMLQQNSLMYNALNIDLKVRLLPPPPSLVSLCCVCARVRVRVLTACVHNKQELYARLYELLPFIPTHSIKSPELVKSLLHCLSLMSKDKKQVRTHVCLLVGRAIIRPGLTPPLSRCPSIVWPALPSD